MNIKEPIFIAKPNLGKLKDFFDFYILIKKILIIFLSNVSYGESKNAENFITKLINFLSSFF